MRCQFVVRQLLFFIAAVVVVGTQAANPLSDVASYLRLPSGTRQQLSRIPLAKARRSVMLSLNRIESEVNALLTSTQAACVPDTQPAIRFTPNRLVPTVEDFSSCQKRVSLEVLQCRPDRSDLQVESQLNEAVGIYRLSWLENVSQACSAVYQKNS